jgi:hypothetical protein
MTRSFLVIICGVLMATDIALAEDRKELRSACRDDARRYCANVQREPATIKQCLLAQKDKLSPPLQDCRGRTMTRLSPSAWR